MLPRDKPEAPFEQPWHAELFAVTHALSATGVFAWTDWAECFGAALAQADAAGSPKDGSAYYDTWLAAFEHFLETRGLADGESLRALHEAWTEAYLRTPHGSPVELSEA